MSSHNIRANVVWSCGDGALAILLVRKLISISLNNQCYGFDINVVLYRSTEYFGVAMSHNAHRKYPHKPVV